VPTIDVVLLFIIVLVVIVLFRIKPESLKITFKVLLASFHIEVSASSNGRRESNHGRLKRPQARNWPQLFTRWRKRRWEYDPRPQAIPDESMAQVEAARERSHTAEVEDATVGE
jgi:hypothetical protein